MNEYSEYVTVECLFGSIQPMTEYKWEGDRLVCYSWAVHRDENGRVTKVTEKEALSSMNFAGVDAESRQYASLVCGAVRK